MSSSLRRQAEEAKKTVEILIDRETGIGVSTVMEACLSMEKANGTVGPVVIAAAIEATPRQPPSLSSNSRAPGAKATGKSETAAGGGKSSEKESGDDKVEQERPQAEYLTSGGAHFSCEAVEGVDCSFVLTGFCIGLWARHHSSPWDKSPGSGLERVAPHGRRAPISFDASIEWCIARLPTTESLAPTLSGLPEGIELGSGDGGISSSA